MVVRPGGGRDVRRNRGSLAGTRRSIRLECVLVPRVGLADLAHALYGTAPRGGAVPRSRTGVACTGNGRRALHDARPPIVCFGVPEVRRRDPRFELRAVAGDG